MSNLILNNSNNNNNDILKSCELCPRRCRTNRYENKGFCLAGSDIVVSKICFHKWEEPCICSENGVGAIFFSGCPLHCCFCQNNAISSKIKGDILSISELSDKMLELQSGNASAIDLVTPTHFSYQIAKSLEKVKHRLRIPVVYNCSGYENIETLKMLDGLIDIYMPDFKYFYRETAKNYSNAEDYPEVAKSAITYMTKQTGGLVYEKNKGNNNNKYLKKGVIVRHLVLPKHRHESIDLINWLGKTFSEKQIIVSLMSQYTPCVQTEFKELSRHITKMEYYSVADELEKFNFDGYVQNISSATEKYIPDF